MLPQRQMLRRRRSPPPSARAVEMTGKYRPRRITLRDGREVTLRAIVEADAAEIVQAFERLSAQSPWRSRKLTRFRSSEVTHQVHSDVWVLLRRSWY